MLAIRLQRTGRSGHAQYRMVVQDSRRTPTSGKIVTALGNYDPHSKALNIDKEKAATYLNNGAQPSPRVAVLLANEGITLPSWVKSAAKKERAIKRPDHLRKNQPAEEAAPEATDEAPAAESTEAAADETTAEEN